MQKRILIVEDTEINRELLIALLSPKYAVLEAENGQEALAVLEKYKEDISLILLDIQMPVMDGYTFLSIVKANPVYAAIPVIVVTQSDSEEDEVTALSRGAADFVAKPYKPQIILHRVAGIIHLRETAAMINQFKFDRLTGLYSREFFYQRVKEILRRNPQQDYDIICSNIENFKFYNDVFGTTAGDRVLCEIARLYREQAGEDAVIGRLNSDRFALLARGRREYTAEMFQTFAAAVNELPNAGSIVVKWGIYSVEDRKVPVDRMCDWALLAARGIKGKYGKIFAVYDDKLRGELLRQQAIIDSMETALEEEQFQVYLQPKYSLRDKTLAGAEALVRWKHPEWGLLSPAAFVPIFEKNGFITKMDQYVWEKVCSILKSWKDKGYFIPPVSVNVSRADVFQEDIADILIHIVKKYDLSPGVLHLEITESAYTENYGQIIETVKHLREFGFVVEMDDFGSGYSSLNVLNQMPIDILKLDMNFIRSETSKSPEAGILKFIMELARHMGVAVVAEGVETKEQLDKLESIGCDYAQGYYFAKPMPEAEFEMLMQKPAAREK